MAQLILAVNAGSSSIKVSVYEFHDDKEHEPTQLADISISGLTAPPAKLSYKRNDAAEDDESAQIKDKELPDVKDPPAAFDHVLKHLIADSGLPQLADHDSITFVCHRIVHGGDFDRPVRIDKATYQRLEDLSDLAPLHNAGALEIVRAVHEQCPRAINAAFFDSAFHATLPNATKTYAIDQEVAKKNKLRKYGFHGLSYAFITRACAAALKKPTSETNLIALHLGSGCSACCIRQGESIATTMGLTPLSGLPGATRSGDVDPSLIFHFTHDAGKLSPSSTKDMHITTAEEILNKKSGWKALTGTTDFGEISKKADQGDPDCKLAFDIVIDRLCDYIGSYYVKLGGEVDALVFAGGVGEKGVQLRSAVVQRLACLGFVADDGKNADVEEAVVADISGQTSRHRLWVVQTDEQTEMARQCALASADLRSGQ